MKVLVVGHLTSHLDPIVRGLREHFNVDVISWKPLQLLRWGSSLLVVPWLILRILIKLMMRRTDLIFAQWTFPDGFSSTLISRLMNVPIVIQVIGSDLLIGADPQVEGIKKRLISWTISRASGVICVSKELEQLARSMGAQCTVTIPSPLDVSDLPVDIQVERVKRRLVTVALLTKIKGIDVLLRALEGVKDAELLVIGDGPERSSLEELSVRVGLGCRVRFLGQIPHKEIWQHLLSSSIFILPSLSEGLPRALLEAMACGLFIVASRIGGIPEAIRDGWNGVLVSPQDSQALKEAILRALADENCLETAGERNRLEAQRFMLARVAEQQSQFLNSIVTRARPRRTTGQSRALESK